MSLSRTVDRYASISRFTLLSNNRRATTGASLRHNPRLRIPRAQRKDRAQNLRNNIAGFSDDNGIANTHILTQNLVFVMEGSSSNRRASNQNRIKLGNRRARACSPNLNSDITQDSGFFFWREFVSNGPARSACREAKLMLQGKRIHLHNHTVDFIGQIGTLLQAIAAEPSHLFARDAALNIGVYVKAATTEPLQQLPLP